jgi:molybdopterin-guanine dinucleotide biosynthesis protein B
MRVLSIVGHSNSGKTTLITNIVPILAKRGLKVLVVKHSMEFEIDKEGKDSWRIFNSGVDVVISSSKKLAFIGRIPDDLDGICRMFGERYDLIITEGFNRACRDRIVVLNDPNDLEHFKCGNILAIVADFEVEGYRCFKKNEYEKIAEFILDWFDKAV